MREQPLADALASLDPSSPKFATEAVEHILAEARRAGASDVHLQPASEGLEIRWRLDGVLNPVATLPPRVVPNIVARLKVLADLLTYRTDVPQEGRIRVEDDGVEMRLCTFPTLHGEKAVIRLFGGPSRFARVRDLGWPEEVESSVLALLESTSGAVVFSGPAGSGKTTSIYASLRELAAREKGARGIATLEDPIEIALDGVAQTQVNPAAGLTLETGLRSMLRQDPEVIAIGEIRDRATAEVAIQASLTGHLILTTFHAGSACEVIGRLVDMEIEPYMIRSGLIAIIAQRLVRRLCECSLESDRLEHRLGLAEGTVRIPAGCERCRGTGYLGRTVLAEMLLPHQEALGKAILERRDVRTLERLAVDAGMVSRWDRARRLVADGVTSPSEIVRVLGGPPKIP
jgi:type II secretory ATPase GspE/PulE/Tfp pilus assembly ATPase PilB-like protein